jgi:transcriptional repressor NrdR
MERYLGMPKFKGVARESVFARAGKSPLRGYFPDDISDNIFQKTEMLIYLRTTKIVFISCGETQHVVFCPSPVVFSRLLERATAAREVVSMRCPYCLDENSKVVDKRDTPEEETIRRRRECLSCQKRYTTYERIELTGITVKKKDGRREGFDRGKLLGGVLKACEKRPISRERIEKLVSGIEAELRNLEGKEIESTEIGKLAMEKLRDLDKVAYIRFASVYREFDDISSFERELVKLKKNPEKKSQGESG